MLPHPTLSVHSVDAAARACFECVAVLNACGALRMRELYIDLEPPRVGGRFDKDGVAPVCAEHLGALAVGECHPPSGSGLYWRMCFRQSAAWFG